ncbi:MULTISPECIES: rhodanese-like domain-containing protein [Clostridium]|uniref:Rhodanese-like domain-containing protein n=1 Tax=Clostridium aquiflavi TaxID=3073603 RepID=A0ABU1EF31_9CLOT|nr:MULTISPECIES: rhodanese-like domain-containing protein [unclassified Clostridium]MDR5586992.1 rhodanese-like domain-containing protein [Clostridium sp. 5N-1]NFG60456.1 rhodanese-like domain-containing protein [Clostridium botulinum]NFQ09901.1 rhodanese-like domain-containing protein [Clostridium botulinum]
MNENTNKKITTIDVSEIDELLGKIELIDIREPFEYRVGSLKTSKNIPMHDLLDNADNYLDKNKEYYLICRSGARTASVCIDLREKGFDVINVYGGMISYDGDQLND